MRRVSVGEAGAEREAMVRLWVAKLIAMPETRCTARDRARLEEVCAHFYDEFLAAMSDDDEGLLRYIKEIVACRAQRDFGTGEVLCALWSLRGVAMARQWTPASLRSLDAVICRATVAFAELLDDLRSEQGYLSVLKSLAMAVEGKDRYTSCHCHAVQRIAATIAGDLGVEIGHAGLLHDLGKLHVPDGILKKPARLTPAEYDIVKQHSVHSYRILLPLEGTLPAVVLSHHERPDGRGYPFGVSKVAMPSAIVAVADTLHAIVSDRPYRAARPFDEAIEIVNAARGTQLREEPVAALNRVKDVLREIEGGAA